MANVPDNLHYSKDHEWVRVEGDTAVIGITDHAQEQLGDVVYVELPKVGEEFVANDSFGSVESVKAVSEIFTPLAGKVSETNQSLNDEPEKVNQDPYGDGWMIKMTMSNPGEVDSLLTAAEYDIPVIWIVENNNMHGITWHCSKLLGKGRGLVASRYRRPLEIAAMSRAMGLHALVVDGPGQMQAAVREAIRVGGPAVIEVRVDGSVPPPMGERARSLAGFIEK